MCETRLMYVNTATFEAKPGRRDDVIALLLSDQEPLRELGCSSYLVGTNDANPDFVYVTETWSSKAAHDDSLKLESVRAAIAEAMPMLTGNVTSVEFDVVGGLGSE